MKATYQITVANPGGLAAPSDGFIDPVRLENHGTLASVTLEDAQAKKRANIRFRTILDILGMESNPIFESASAVGASSKVEATSLELVVTFKGDVTIIRDEESVVGALAVKRLVAEALIISSERVVDVYSPTAVALIEPLVVQSIAATLVDAMALVTVVKV